MLSRDLFAAFDASNPELKTYRDKVTLGCEDPQTVINRVNCLGIYSPHKQPAQAIYTMDRAATIQGREGHQPRFLNHTMENLITLSRIPVANQKPKKILVNNAKIQEWPPSEKEEANAPKKRVLKVNLGNAGRPGGGFDEGNIAQEEQMVGFSDALFHMPVAYPKANIFGLELLGGSYCCPQVQNYKLDAATGKYEPDGLPFAMVVVCAPSFHPGHDPTRERKNYYNKNREEYIGYMSYKIRSICEYALEENFDAIALGALGCGMFYNNPYLVAALFRVILSEDKYKDLKPEFVIFEKPPAPLNFIFNDVNKASKEDIQIILDHAPPFDESLYELGGQSFERRISPPLKTNNISVSDYIASLKKPEKIKTNELRPDDFEKVKTSSPSTSPSIGPPPLPDKTKIKKRHIDIEKTNFREQGLRLKEMEVYVAACGIFNKHRFQCLGAIHWKGSSNIGNEIARVYRKTDDGMLYILYRPGKDNSAPPTLEESYTPPLDSIMKEANEKIREIYGDHVLANAKKIFVVGESNTYYGIPVAHYIKGDVVNDVLTTVDSIDRDYNESYITQSEHLPHQKRKVIKTGYQNMIFDHWSCGYHSLEAIERDLTGRDAPKNFELTGEIIKKHFNYYQLGAIQPPILTAPKPDENLSLRQVDDHAYNADEINAHIESYRLPHYHNLVIPDSIKERTGGYDVFSLVTVKEDKIRSNPTFFLEILINYIKTQFDAGKELSPLRISFPLHFGSEESGHYVSFAIQADEINREVAENIIGYLQKVEGNETRDLLLDPYFTNQVKNLYNNVTAHFFDSTKISYLDPEKHPGRGQEIGLALEAGFANVKLVPTTPIQQTDGTYTDEGEENAGNGCGPITVEHCVSFLRTGHPVILEAGIEAGIEVGVQPDIHTRKQYIAAMREKQNKKLLDYRQATETKVVSSKEGEGNSLLNPQDDKSEMDSLLKPQVDTTGKNQIPGDVSKPPQDELDKLEDDFVEIEGGITSNQTKEKGKEDLKKINQHAKAPPSIQIPVSGKIGSRVEDCFISVKSIEKSLRRNVKDRNLEIIASEENGIIRLKVLTPKTIKLFTELGLKKIPVEGGHPYYELFIDRNTAKQNLNDKEKLFKLRINVTNQVKTLINEKGQRSRIIIKEQVKSLDVSHMFTDQEIINFRAKVAYALPNDRGYDPVLNAIRGVNHYLKKRAKKTSGLFAALTGSYTGKDYDLRRLSWRRILEKINSHIEFSQMENLEETLRQASRQTLLSFIEKEADQFKPGPFTIFPSNYYTSLMNLHKTISEKPDYNFKEIAEYVGSFYQIYEGMDPCKSTMKKWMDNRSLFFESKKEKKYESRLNLESQLYDARYQMLSERDREFFLDPNEEIMSEYHTMRRYND